MFWGITPALDLQEQYLEHLTEREELNILIVGGADARHILKTVSRCYCHKPVKLNFFIMDATLEQIARQILLLNIALQSPAKLSLIWKTKIFMELYGNTLVRPSVAKYLTRKAEQLVQMITNLDYCYDIMTFINLNGLKYKERDYLENIFKYWCSITEPFCICELWDKRVRKSLGVRYDTKNAAFDWDLQMQLYYRGADHISPQEYKHWRSTGVAFVWMENEVSKANRTLVCGIVPAGEKFLHYGYLGDILSGPYIAYGLDCELKEMLKKYNGINAKRSTDITEYNLMKMFHEITEQKEYQHAEKIDTSHGISIMEVSENRVVENVDCIIAVQEKQKDETESKCIDLQNIHINILSCDMLQYITQKGTYKGLYNLVYFSNDCISKIKPGLINICNLDDGCLLLLETQKFIPMDKKDQLAQLEEKLNNISSYLPTSCKLPFDSTKDSYVKFVIKNVM